MPYPDSRDDRAWELFMQLRSTLPEHLSDRKSRHAAAEVIAYLAYDDADAFEKVRQKMSKEATLAEQPPGEGEGSATNLAALAQNPELVQMPQQGENPQT